MMKNKLTYPAAFEIIDYISKVQSLAMKSFPTTTIYSFICICAICKLLTKNPVIEFSIFEVGVV